MAEEVKTEIVYVGTNINQWSVKNYIVSEQRGDWFCTCSIKHKRNPKLKCKHIDLVKAFLLTPEEKQKIIERHERRMLREKLKSFDLKSCKNHIFLRDEDKGAIYYKCNSCNGKLTLDEYKYYRKEKNLC